MNEDIFGGMRGSWVIVRSRGSGVWSGRLVCANEDGMAVQIADGIRLWSWEGALSCSSLAVTGPTGGKIDVPTQLAMVTEVCECVLQTGDSRAACERAVSR